MVTETEDEKPLDKLEETSIGNRTTVSVAHTRAFGICVVVVAERVGNELV